MKWFSSELASAPVLNGVAGALRDLLNAVLVDGFGLKTASSVVIASGICTLTVSGGHTFVPSIVAVVAGATTSGGSINGEHRVTATGLNTISFPVALADQTATGTITIKVAPLGWTKAQTGTNKAAYKSSELDATGLLLRVDDTGTTAGRVMGYESMSDVDTGINPFPTAAQCSGGLYWGKSDVASSAARGWYIFGDEYGFHFCPKPASAQAIYRIYFFGDFIGRRPGAPYDCMLTGGRDVFMSDSNGTPPEGDLAWANSSSGTFGDTTSGRFIARTYTGLGGSKPCSTLSSAYVVNGLGNSQSGASAWPLKLPNPVNNGLELAQVVVFTDGGQSNAAIRGRVPGLIFLHMDWSNAFATGDTVPGSGEFVGRDLMAVKVGDTSSAAANKGIVFFDLGDWR